MKTFDFLVNGYNVQAEYTDDFLADCENLIQKWQNMAREKKERCIIFLAAPPGAGKSTLALLFEQLAKTGGKACVQALGMDGFHHYQDYILHHDVNVDGKRYSMKEMKGCPESFDFQRLLSYVKKLKQNDVMFWPVYDRRLHDVIDDQIKVDAPIVLIEGNYLLLDEMPWRQLYTYCDDSLFLRTDEKQVRKRLIQRKVMGGMLVHEALRFCERSDLANVRRILKHQLAANVEIELKQGQYTFLREKKQPR